MSIETKRPPKIVDKIVSKMHSCGLGLKRKTFVLSSYNPLWSIAFDWIKEQINQQLAESLEYRLEHFGSTSIPGIRAKPVLDVMLIFENLETLQQSIKPMEGLGFIYKGDAISTLYNSASDPERHFFSFYNLTEDTDYIHLHSFTKDHPDVRRNLSFRDKLRADSCLAQEYEAVKQKLCESSFTRHGYTCAKGDFVKKVDIIKFENKLVRRNVKP